MAKVGRLEFFGRKLHFFLQNPGRLGSCWIFMLTPKQFMSKSLKKGGVSSWQESLSSLWDLSKEAGESMGFSAAETMKLCNPTKTIGW